MKLLAVILFALACLGCSGEVCTDHVLSVTAPTQGKTCKPIF